MTYVDVYIGCPVDGPFTYKVPPAFNVTVGRRVMVNFAGRNEVAYVAACHQEKPEGFAVKELLDVIDDEPIYDDRLLDLIKHVSKKYISSPGEALSMALPSGKRESMRFKAPFKNNSTKRVSLSDEQKTVFDNILIEYKKGNRLNLIYGVTGSGKTEVYIELARHFIKQQKSVILLVPEISLSSQIFERLHAIFGEELVIYHSALTANQRLYNWKSFYSGKAKIVIGTRSAVFLQCPSLGLIIVDEEHDGSYKEHSSPRYNAKGIAFYRAAHEGSAVVMGGATPSVELLYACERGMVNLYKLKERYGSAGFPKVEIVKVSGNSGDIVSPLLKVHTKRAVESGNQVIFLLNRRGFSPLVICNDCSTVVECPHCNISLNYHATGMLLCHYCGHKQPLPDRCSQCGSENLKRVGSGTQRVEERLRELYKNYTVARLDQDSSRKKGAVFDLIDKMDRGEIDILLGTQMVSKGFDFPNVTVSGVLIADIGINMPDFRSTERIFSLLMQIAGRSGRGDKQGHVVIQTLNEDQDIFHYLKNHDYFAFYRSELEKRKLLQYPPFTRIARLLARGKDEQSVITFIDLVKKELEGALQNTDGLITMLGPSSAPIEKIANNFRHHIILKARSAEALRTVITPVTKKIKSKNVYLEIDIDPYDLL